MKRLKNHLIWAIGVCEIIAFAAFAFWILVTRNSDTLYQAQNFSFFSGTGVFFNECMQLPGGLISWMASYLTQFFYEPSAGAFVIIAIWLTSLSISKFALRVPAIWTGFMLIPLFALLTSVVDNGYWLYYIKQQGFWFYATVGYLIAMLMTLIATVGSNLAPARVKPFYSIGALVLISLTYPLFGIYSTAALCYSAVVMIVNGVPKKNGQSSFGTRWKFLSILIGVSALLALIVPRIAYNHYANIRIEDIYTVGLPAFRNEDMVSTTPLHPFYILLAAPIILALIRFVKRRIRYASALIVLANLTMFALCAYTTERADFQDYNYHAEIRMYKAMENQQWDEALTEMGLIKDAPTRQMIMSKNIALFNNGDIGSQMFAYRNDSKEPTNGFDTLRIHMVQTAAPLIYMYHGRTHFANRWCIENMVEYGKSFNNLKILSLCALVNGEMDLARKYLSTLKTSLYYKEWAERYWPITEKPELIKDFHEFDTIRELHGSFSSILDSDAGLCEVTSCTPSPPA